MEIKVPIKSIEWEVTSRCNYKCEYCFQQWKETKDCSDSLVEKVLEFTGSLSDSWFVKLIGGEPFMFKHFFEVCQTLIGQGHCLGLTSNFSFPRSVLERLINCAGGGLKGVSASLHLSQTKDIKEFIDKCEWFLNNKHQNTDFVVTSVLKEDNFEQLKDIANELGKRGVRFEYQRIKIDGKYQRYCDEIEEYIKGKFNSNEDKTFELESFGTKCYTGLYFFRILLSGSVARCYNGQPLYRLGSLAKGSFKPFKKVMPCTAKKCTCSTPANRNMVIWDEKYSPIVTVAKVLPEYVVRKVAEKLE